MNAREVVTRYYEFANAGDWDAWCDLFAATRSWMSSSPDTSKGGKPSAR